MQCARSRIAPESSRSGIILHLERERLFAGVSATLGVFAIAAEISLAVIGALIVIAIVYAVIDHIGLF